MPKKSVPTLTGRVIRCILFDLGDTLWSRKDMAIWQQVESASNTRAAALLRKCIASPVLPDLADAELGKRLHESVDEHIRTLLRQEPDFEPDGGLAVLYVLEQWGIAEVARNIGEAVFEAFRVRIPESRPLFDDVLPTLKTLKQRGFQLGIVSNRHWGGKLFQEDLQKLGLLDYFDLRHMAISVDLGVRKPNPAIFLHTLNALNLAPEQAVMVGDSLLSDIVGAKMLDIFAVWKPKPGMRTQTQLITSGAATKNNHSEPTADERPGSLPVGLHITDDDYVLAQVQSRAGKWDQHMHGEIKPDLVIENLSDLLDVFIEVGEQ